MSRAVTGFAAQALVILLSPAAGLIRQPEVVDEHKPAGMGRGSSYPASPT